MFGIFGIFLLISIGLVSAGWFDWITGNAVSENSVCFNNDTVNNWITKFNDNVNFCSESDGLITPIPDECIDDSGSSASGDNLEIYCSDHSIKLCLSGEECPWRENISSDNENSCVGNYSGEFVRIINYQSAEDEREWWKHNETLDTIVYCNKNYDETTTWSKSSISSKNSISNSEQERICYNTSLVRSWIERFSNGNSCSESRGLIATIPDKCVDDSGSSIQGDNLEIYCSNGKIKLCLSGEECPWRTSISSEDKNTCVGDYEDKFVELYDYYGMNEDEISEKDTSDLTLYCNKNSDGTRDWSLGSSSEVKQKIDHIFGRDSSKLVVYPENRIISLNSGSRNKGFAFSVKNTQENLSKFNYTIYVNPSYNLTANCGSLTIKEAESWITNPTGTLTLAGESSNSDNPELILFTIPESAPECTILYTITVNKDGELYSESQIYLSVVSSSSEDNENDEQETPSTCQLGYRENGSYCDKSLEMVTQKVAESVCDNSFECESNLCIDSQCVSGSLWTKFMNWLNDIFG